MTIENAGYKLTGKIEAEEARTYNVAILFDYIQDESTTVEADITDNWVESNYSIQDHIAIKPRIYRLRGCVGEVIYENTWQVLDRLEVAKQQHPLLAKTINAVNAISGISGIVSNYTRLAINAAKQIESSIDRYKKAWQNFRNKNEYLNKRQNSVYETLRCMLQNRIPVNLENMMYTLDDIKANQYNKQYYLQSVTAHQSDSLYISDIEVTIKEFRVATTRTTKPDPKKFAGLVATAKTAMANNGDAKGNTIAPETAQKAVGSVAEKNKEVAKAALKGKPMAYNAAKTFYNSLEKAATTGFIPIGK